ncbi:MAG TPA: hypothetical protein VKB86_18120, partial [Pyrinomonadaceae bacterium]|nr:hypothetical protein [Pyrinomonadaceae bacterium]
MRFPLTICALLILLSLFAGCKKDVTQESTVNATAPEQAADAQSNQQAAAPAETAARPSGPIEFTDVTAQAGIHFKHNSGAFGKKYLPETLGPGCAFLDYDNDGWQDILLVNSTN